LTFCLLQPADAFLKDVEIMVRTLVAGAVVASPKPRTVTPATAKKSLRRNPGGRE
jgi:hypothetical protein